MKKETRDIIEKIVIWFSPIFTLIMFSFSRVAFFKSSSKFGEFSPIWANFYELLIKSDVNVFCKVIMWASLIGVIASIVLYVLSVVLKNKEKLFTKIAAITLVASTGILFFTTFGKLITDDLGISKWSDFMAPLYGLLIIYNVAVLIFVVKKDKKLDKIN